MILGLSGKKQSGKDTIATWLVKTTPVFKVARRYGFTDRIKQIAHYTFGVPFNLLNGTEAEKNTEVFPGYTVRQVCQTIGNLFRDINPSVWTEGLMREIKSIDRPSLLAVIADVQFPDEVRAIHQAGGRVIRLTRSLHADPDISETALDGFTDFDAVIDNQNLSIFDTKLEAVSCFRKFGWV